MFEIWLFSEHSELLVNNLNPPSAKFNRGYLITRIAYKGKPGVLFQLRMGQISLIYL